MTERRAAHNNTCKKLPGQFQPHWMVSLFLEMVINSPFSQPLSKKIKISYFSYTFYQLYKLHIYTKG